MTSEQLAATRLLKTENEYAKALTAMHETGESLSPDMMRFLEEHQTRMLEYLVFEPAEYFLGDPES